MRGTHTLSHTHTLMTEGLNCRKQKLSLCLLHAWESRMDLVLSVEVCVCVCVRMRVMSLCVCVPGTYTHTQIFSRRI